MKKIIVTVVTYILLVVSALGENRTAMYSVNLRENSNTSSIVLEVIPLGAQVDVVRDLSNGWSLVIYKSRIGFVYTSFLRSGATLKTENIKAPTFSDSKTYRNSDGQIVRSPVSAPVAPPGATARCVDGTYSFSQHRQGTCSHHGGVAKWL